MSTYKSVGSGGTLTSYSIDLSEQHLYGSGRIGILNRTVNMKVAFVQAEILTFERGHKQYELSNHLGNVLVTITDKKAGVSTNGTTIDNFIAEVSSANDYYPFGMGMPDRKFSTDKYRYGFNGKENDKEFGEGMQDYGMRINDKRLGRFLSVDPLTKKFPHYTPYQYAGNTPVQAIDLDGAEDRYFMTDIIHTWSGETKIGKTTEDQTRRVKWNNLQFAGSEGHGTLITFRHFYQEKNGHTTAVIKETQLFIPDPTWYESLVKSGDESKKVKFGYHIYGRGKDISWQKGLPTAAEGSEVLDLGNWLDFAAGLRQSESVGDLTQRVVDKLGGVKNENMKAIQQALDIVSNQSENIVSSTEKILEARDQVEAMQEREKIIRCDYCEKTYENKNNKWVETKKEHTDSAEYHGNSVDKTPTRRRKP